MCDRPWETMTDADFEAMLARSVPDVPPEEIVAEVTPWRRAMNRILFGLSRPLAHFIGCCCVIC